MIAYLAVQNYALIESLELRLSEGINIITGETGAGKSILIGALSMLLGRKADTDVLLDKDKKCIVEAHFNLGHYKLEPFFALNDLDYEPVTIVRRDIAPNGRSRAFINDTPVNLSQLKDFTSMLIDIHSQHDTISLLRPAFQMAVLDDFAETSALLESYRTLFNAYLKNKKHLAQLTEQKDKAEAEQDYLSFLYTELHTAALTPGEQEEAESELSMLSNAEDIKQSLGAVLNSLLFSDQGILMQLKDINSRLNQISRYIPSLEETLTRTNSAYIELKDIASSLEKTEQTVNYDPERIEVLNERLNTLYGLLKKHKALNVEELLSLSEELSQKMSAYVSLGTELEAISQTVNAQHKQLMALAAQLTAERSKRIPVLEKKITALLTTLAMPAAVFKAELSTGTTLHGDGTDALQFLFSANKGIAPADMAKVASGGELSRLMLAIKSVISQKKLLPTLIFDEIDTGISGETAVKTAGIISDMGKHMQIIAITHLPQIAGTGKNHFQVIKNNSGTRTLTEIHKLSTPERVKTIASMISGHNLTEASLKTATELLEKFSE